MKSANLIVSRYKENLDWLKDVPDCVTEITVYNKGLSLPKFVDKRISVINLPNVGREGQTMLHHFVHRRNNLADVTFTVQGYPLDHSPDLMGRLALDYPEAKSLSKWYIKGWPKTEYTQHDRLEIYKGFEIRSGLSNFFGCRTEFINRFWIRRWWPILFSSPQPTEHYYAYGAQWAIPKAAILARSAAYWERLLKMQNEAGNTHAFRGGIDPWMLECAWELLLKGPDAYPGAIK